MRIVRELISIERGKELLDNNNLNRKLNKKRVKDFAATMTGSTWKEDNGDTITVCKNGDLLDGQHRLHAQQLAGVPLYFWMAYDAEPEVKNSIDTGKSRTIADVFSMNGASYATQKASLSKYIDSWIRKSAHHDRSFGGSLGGMPQLSHEQQFDLFNLYQKEFDWLSPYAEKNIINGCGKGQLTFALLLLRQNKSKAKLEEFLGYFQHGGDYSDSPTHRLPFFLMDRRDSDLKRHRREDLFLVLHAYDLWEDQQPWIKRNIRLDFIIGKNHGHFYKKYKIKGKWKDIITEDYFKSQDKLVSEKPVEEKQADLL